MVIQFFFSFSLTSGSHMSSFQPWKIKGFACDPLETKGETKTKCNDGC